MTARETLDRVDLAQLLTELGGAPVGHGARARWHCFDQNHDDTDPSVTMFTDRSGVERWRCWSGGHAGTAIDAVMTAKDLDTAAAISWLEERVGIHRDPDRPPPTPAPARAARQDLSWRARKWIDSSERRLRGPAGAAAQRWINDRGIDAHTARANRLGYSPAAPRGTNTYGIPPHEAVTIPTFDQSGEPVFVQARNLSPAAPCKYSNITAGHGTCPTISYPRGGPSSGPLVVTEGVLDGLVVISAGFRTASLISVAAAAEHTAEATAGELAAFAGDDLIVLALDHDPAGVAATEQLKAHLPVEQTRVLRLPDGHDLTSTRQGAHQCNTTRAASPTASLS